MGHIHNRHNIYFKIHNFLKNIVTKPHTHKKNMQTQHKMNMVIIDFYECLFSIEIRFFFNIGFYFT